MSKTILMFGVSGFIGSYLLEELLRKDFKVIIMIKGSLADMWRIEKFFDQIKVYDMDQCDLDAPFLENKIDLVINLITNFGRNPISDNPSQIIETNVVLALKIIEEARKAKVQYYFNIDSSLKSNVSLYAYSKSIFKHIIKNLFAEHIRIFNLRLEYVYGEKDDVSKFISFAISKLKNNKELNMSGGKQNLDFIYVKDCVNAIAHIAENTENFPGQFEEFQIGTGKTMLLKDFIEIIKNQLNSKSVINYGAIEYRKNEQMFSQADISKIKGWYPQYDVNNIDFSKFI